MKKTLIIYTNPKKPNAVSLMRELCAASEEAGFNAVPFADEALLAGITGRQWAETFCVVTLGGDGTILRAVSAAAPHGVPVLGVNMGRIGFFSEIGADEFGLALRKLERGEYALERPSMLTCLVNGESFGECLNDFSVHREELSSITQLELSVDGDAVGDVMADGLIVATPSGSTAYTMSAGGPVVAPKLDCILVTPICPHSLTVRPIVASTESVVEARIKCVCRLSRDGQSARILEPGDRLVFRRSERSAAFIRFEKRNVFRLIREKLK
ncbi:MAG: NAD(+)/NADH kinase [Clostridia bacterium]|nr:NAD(+)/NADH kinase [Clostridia bacterium]